MVDFGSLADFHQVCIRKSKCSMPTTTCAVLTAHLTLHQVCRSCSCRTAMESPRRIFPSLPRPELHLKYPWHRVPNGMGCPVASEPALKAQKTANTSLGIDCHTNDPSFIPLQARMLLQLTRVERNAEIVGEGNYPSGNVTGTTEEVFNLATIGGARCLGLEDEIGSIKVGKKADLVIFDAPNSVGILSAAEFDPVVAVVRFSEAADIEYVIVNGVVRQKEGKLVATDVSLDRKGAKNLRPAFHRL